MKLKKLSALCLAASSMMVATTAMAWQSEDGMHEVTGNISLLSDYVFRGISQTSNKPAIQGGLDYGHASGFYLGTWGSNVDFGSGDDAKSEFNIWGGFASEIGDTGIGYDLGVVRYLYPGVSGDYDFNEIYAGLSYSFFSLGVWHSSNFANSGDTGTYYNLGFEYGLPYEITFMASIGYQDLDSNIGKSYNDFMIGVSKNFADLDFSLTWTDTDSDGYDNLDDNDLAKNIFTFSVSKSF